MIRYIKLSVTLLVFLSALFLSGFGEGITTAKAVDPEAADGPTAPLAVCTASTPGMVAYWPLDDPQITPPMTFDDRLNNPPEHPGHPGTCSSAGSCPTSTSGIVGDAYSFDGNDVIAAPDGDDLDFGIDDSFSIEMWVKTSQICHVENLPPDPGTAAPKVFTSKWSNGASWWVGCSLYWDAINLVNIDVATFSLRSSAGGDGDEISDVKAINDNLWHHVVAVREFTGPSAGEGVNRLYVDGLEVAMLAKTYAGTFANENPLTFGVHAGSYFYNGVLDEVAIYSQALAPGDITAHYNAGAGTTYCDEPLRATNPGDQVSTEDSAIAEFDIEHTPSSTPATSYSATGLPPGISINPSTGQISGTPTYEAAAGSPYPVIATVNTASGSDTTAFSWTVNNVNRPPVIDDPSMPGAQNNIEGASISLPPITATDLDGDLVTFTAPNLPPGVSINPTSGVISGTIEFDAYESGSPYTVVVTATDNGTPIPLTDTGQFIWTITNANSKPEVDNPGDRTNNAGDLVTLQIIATDEDGDELEYTSTGLPDGLSLGQSSGMITGMLTSNSIGVHDVAVTVSDGFEGNEVTVEFTWTITSNAPVVINPGNKTNKERDSVSLQIMATDEDGDDLTYTASGLPLDLSINAGTGLISGILSSSSAGSYTVVVTVSDGVSDRSVQFVWTVTNVEFNFMPLIIQVTP